MIALHFRDNWPNIFWQANRRHREAAAISAVYPFYTAGIPVPWAVDTHAHRTSINSQF